MLPSCPWCSLPKLYLPKTSEDIEVDDILNLTYMPNTVEDIVLTQTPAPMTATALGGHTCGNTPLSPRVQDLFLEFKKGIKLVLEPFAELKDNKQWDSVHWTLKAHQTACYHQDVDAFLHLSYVPNTAADTVLLEEKQKYMYLVQASCRKKSPLIDQGAIGGITGIDTRVIEHHPCRTVVASITMRSLPFLLSLLELLRDLNRRGNSYNAPVRISSAARKVNSFFMSIGIFCQWWQQQSWITTFPGVYNKFKLWTNMFSLSVFELIAPSWHETIYGCWIWINPTCDSN